MELQHRFIVPTSVDETWALFNDLEVVAPCFPGAALTSAEGDDFAGTVKVKLGPVALQYSGTGTFVERDEATHTARIEAKGKDKRGNGTAAAKVKTVLLADGTGTAVEVSTDLSVTGKPAQFGRGLMQDVSDKLLDRFVACLTDKLTSEPEAADAESSEEPRGVDGAGSSDVPSPVGKPAPAAAESASGTAPTGSGSGPDATSTPTPTPPRAVPPPRAEQEPVALDLGATVLPVLAKRFGPPALVLLVVLLVLRRLLRR